MRSGLNFRWFKSIHQVGWDYRSAYPIKKRETKELFQQNHQLPSYVRELSEAIVVLDSGRPARTYELCFLDSVILLLRNLQLLFFMPRIQPQPLRLVFKAFSDVAQMHFFFFLVFVHNILLLSFQWGPCSISLLCRLMAAFLFHMPRFWGLTTLFETCILIFICHKIPSLCLWSSPWNTV